MPSQVLIEAAQGEETDEVFVVVLTITHPVLLEPIRVANNTEDVVSNGQTFIGFPFGITLANDNAETPRAKLEIQNVDRRIGEAVQALTSPAKIDIALVLASDPDTIEFDQKDMELKDVKGDEISVNAVIVGIDTALWTWPWKRVTEGRFPGLYL